MQKELVSKNVLSGKYTLFNITLPSVYSEFTVHMKMLTLGFHMTCHLSLMQILQNRWF